MSKEIVKHSNNTPAQFNFFDTEQFAVMQRVSKMFSMSELVPDMYKASGEVTAEKAMANCMIALSLAQRLNADPLMVMQNLIIIYGRPSWSSKFLIGTVNTCGRYDSLKYRFTDLGKVGKIEIVEYVWDNAVRKKVAKTVAFDGTKIDNIQCVAYTKEKGSDEMLESSEVTIKMAIEEGWYTKNGSKWKTMPKKMLTYRAASFWTNEYAPEISMGMKTDDEVYDIEDIPFEDIPHSMETERSEKANKKEMTFDEPEETEKGPENENPPVTEDPKVTPPPVKPSF